MPALSPAELLDAAPGEATAPIRARAETARARALARQGCANQALAGRDIDNHAQLEDAAGQFLQTAATRLGWSGRSTHRVLKVARTIADLAQSEKTQTVHVAEAMQYRRGLGVG